MGIPEDVVIIRLLGWIPRGVPVVAAFDCEPAFADRAHGPIRRREKE